MYSDNIMTFHIILLSQLTKTFLYIPQSTKVSHALEYSSVISFEV